MPSNKLKPADFASDQEVRWCPGCGDYAILKSVQRIMPDLGIPKENIVFISGIGCAGRFPYYMDTYGFHTIHGRAPAIATGLKIARPELSVWVVTGDGDAVSIGANHLVHALRRNVDMNILLFNNRIYGLTKGQYSPTSEIGKISKTTPEGSIDAPLNPISLALSSGATFVARALDVDAKNLQNVLTAASQHKGTSFVEIYQNCNIFNDGAFASISDKSVRDDRILYLEDGQAMLFGKEKDKGLAFIDQRIQVVDKNNKDILQHRPSTADSLLPQLLADLNNPELPVPMGIFKQIEKPCYEDQLAAKTEKMLKDNSNDLNDLLTSGHTWTI